MADFTFSNYVLPAVKRRASLPTTNALLLDSDILSLANDVLFSTVVPTIRECREEYFVKTYDQAIVSGQAAYAIPASASSASLRNVQLVDSTGFMVPLTRLDPDTLSGYSLQGLPFGTFLGTTGFYLQDNSVVLWPTPSPGNVTTLRMSIFRRPNDMTVLGNCYAVTSVNTSTGVISFGTNVSALVVGTQIDSTGPLSPFTLGIDGATILANSSTTLTVATTTPGLSTLLAGDYICATTTAPGAQITREAMPFLVQSTAVKCLEAIGDKQGLLLAKASMDELRSALVDELSPRVIGAPQKITNQSGVFHRYGGRRFW